MFHFSLLNAKNGKTWRRFAHWKTEMQELWLSDTTSLSDPTSIPAHAGRYQALIQLFPPNGSYSYILKEIQQRCRRWELGK